MITQFVSKRSFTGQNGNKLTSSKFYVILFSRKIQDRQRCQVKVFNMKSGTNCRVEEKLFGYNFVLLLSNHRRKFFS